MEIKRPTIFIGYFNNDGESNTLRFMADMNCDRREELKFAYLCEYDYEMDDNDIEGVYEMNDVYDYRNSTLHEITIKK